MKRKVAILSNGLIEGGTDTFIINVINGLSKDEYDITVLMLISDKRFAIRECDAINAGAKMLWTCGISNLKGKFKHFILLYRELKNGKYDVFHSNLDLFNGPNMFIAWLAGVKIRVCHYHNSMRAAEIFYGRTWKVILEKI